MLNFKLRINHFHLRVESKEYFEAMQNDYFYKGSRQKKEYLEQIEKGNRLHMSQKI